MAPEPGLPKIPDRNLPEPEKGDQGEIKWSEYKKALDDPNVSVESKKEVLRAMGRPDNFAQYRTVRQEGDPSAVEKEVGEYFDKYRVSKDLPASNVRPWDA